MRLVLAAEHTAVAGAGKRCSVRLVRKTGAGAGAGIGGSQELSESWESRAGSGLLLNREQGMACGSAQSISCDPMRSLTAFAGLLVRSKVLTKAKE